MPYINLRTNKGISSEVELRIKERLGEAISIVGKSEGWLMVEFNDNCKLYFKGSNESPICYVDIKLYGKASREAYSRMTNVICSILDEELGIPASNVYVSYGEYDNWGWNGSNF